MRILLANYHLEDRAGSELYTSELATAFRGLGHEVAVFTFFPGGVAEDLKRSRVPVFSGSSKPERIVGFAPEILHVHHSPCLYYLGHLELNAPIVYSTLGVVPALEAPPMVWPGVAQALAVSEEVRDRLADSAFGEQVPLRIFRNWFDDRSWRRPPGASRRPMKHVAVVSHHLDPTLKASLEAIASARSDFRWQHVGLPNDEVRIGPDFFQAFDGVISIGRTALHAAAAGKPCILYDVHGCDGLLEAHRFDELAKVNFSGRMTRARPTVKELEALLFERAPALDLDALRERVWRDFRLTSRVAELLALYRDVRRTSRPPNARERAIYSGGGRIHAEQTSRIRALVYERERLEAVVRTQERELVAYRPGFDETSAKLTLICVDLARRLVTRARWVRDRLAPPDSMRRALLDRGRFDRRRRRLT